MSDPHFWEHLTFFVRELFAGILAVIAALCTRGYMRRRRLRARRAIREGRRAAVRDNPNKGIGWWEREDLEDEQ